VDFFSSHQFPHLLDRWGYAAILVAIIADSFGLPIPGEVMLLLAAVFSGSGPHLSLALVIGAAVAGAVLGDNVTFILGRRGGYPFLQRHGRRFHLGPERLQIGEYLFRRYGVGVVIVGRLIPVVHIWTAVLAGISRMPYRYFAPANLVGAIIWATALGLAGYGVGRAATRYGDIIAAAGIPVAISIGAVTLLLLRLNERRLQEQAELSLERSGKDGASGSKP
jgi:membrane protein DedA with SNARE-associated domain